MSVFLNLPMRNLYVCQLCMEMHRIFLYNGNKNKDLVIIMDVFCNLERCSLRKDCFRLELNDSSSDLIFENTCVHAQTQTRTYKRIPPPQTHTHAYKYIPTHTETHTYIRTQRHTHKHTHTHTHTHTNTHTHTHTRFHIWWISKIFPCLGFHLKRISFTYRMVILNWSLHTLIIKYVSVD